MAHLPPLTVRSFPAPPPQVPFEANEADLWPIFSEMGAILELVVLRNPQGRSKGCGFVIYESRAMAEKAIEEVDGKVRVDGRRKKGGEEKGVCAHPTLCVSPPTPAPLSVSASYLLSHTLLPPPAPFLRSTCPTTPSSES